MAGMARLARHGQWTDIVLAISNFAPFANHDFSCVDWIAGRTEWRHHCASSQRPLDIPSNPQIAYRSEWKGHGDWLGTDIRETPSYRFPTLEISCAVSRFLRCRRITAAARARVLAPGLPKPACRIPPIRLAESGETGWGRGGQAPSKKA